MLPVVPCCPSVYVCALECMPAIKLSLTCTEIFLGIKDVIIGNNYHS